MASFYGGSSQVHLGPGPGVDDVHARSLRAARHASIGYVTPDDEHEGRGDAIRKARRDGLDQARQNRIDYRRTRRQAAP